MDHKLLDDMEGEGNGDLQDVLNMGQDWHDMFPLRACIEVSSVAEKLQVKQAGYLADDIINCKDAMELCNVNNIVTERLSHWGPYEKAFLANVFLENVGVWGKVKKTLYVKPCVFFREARDAALHFLLVVLRQLNDSHDDVVQLPREVVVIIARHVYESFNDKSWYEVRMAKRETKKLKQ